MGDRDYHLGTRIADLQYTSLKAAADAQALTVAEWVRLAVLRRMSGDDSVSLIRELLAVRIILLNLLYFLGPEGTLTAEALKEVPQRAVKSSTSQLQKLIPGDDEPAAPGSRRRTRQRTVKARLTESQYETVKLSAAAAGITPAEWLRDAVVVQLEHDPLLQILRQRVVAVRFILDESIATLTTDGGRLDHAVISHLTKRTDPAPVGRAKTRPASRDESPQED